MPKVTGIGGIFFKASDPKKLRNWYQENLGLNCDEYGTSFIWKQFNEPKKNGFTVWGPFDKKTDYFEPSEKDYMFNFRVDDLEGILKQLKENGVDQIGETQNYDYGKFAHVVDPEGNKIELWEPNDTEYFKMVDKITPDIEC